VGVIMAIGNTVLGTAGKQLIRMSELAKRERPRMSRVFITLGLFTNSVVGPLIDMAAYSFAPQSLIAPFCGLDVVWNAALAPYILREKLTRARALGCFIIVIGTTFAGVFGNHVESEYTLEYLEDLLIKPRVAIYLGCFLVWFLLNRFFFMRFPAGSVVRGISLGLTAGTVAGNMFCVKAAMELIQRSISGPDPSIWLHWLPYVVLAGAVFFAVSTVFYMTAGLQEFEALFMVTIFEGSGIVSGCFSGSIVLLDMNGLEAWRVGMYWSGVGIIVIGMYVIFQDEAKQGSSLLSGTASIQLNTEQLDAVASSRSSLKNTISKAKNSLGGASRSGSTLTGLADNQGEAPSILRTPSGARSIHASASAGLQLDTVGSPRSATGSTPTASAAASAKVCEAAVLEEGRQAGDAEFGGVEQTVILEPKTRKLEEPTTMSAPTSLVSLWQNPYALRTIKQSPEIDPESIGASSNEGNANSPFGCFGEACCMGMPQSFYKNGKVSRTPSTSSQTE